MAKGVEFRVKISTDGSETVCVVGNAPSLGDWSLSKAIVLSRDTAEDEETWFTTVDIEDEERVEYRYFVCLVIQSFIDGSESRIIRRWESSVIPRKLIVNPSDNTVDYFGHIGNHIPSSVDRGWLTSESIIQIKLHSDAVTIWKKKLRNKKFRIKVTPVNLNKSPSQVSELCICDESTEDNNNISATWPLCETSVLNPDDLDFRQQEQFGESFSPGDFLTFQIQADDVQTVGYLVDVYENTGNEVIPNQIGFTFILPSCMKDSIGTFVTPLTNMKRQPIGQIKVDYVFVKPLEDYECDMSISYSKYWNHTWRGLDVGHRGVGMSFHCAECPNVRENTLASLKRAAEHGADFVEFDVHLSKDFVPVIYHDFHCYIAMKKKSSQNEHDMLEIPVKDLTLEQLRMLKVYHSEEKAINREKFQDDHLEDHQPFPTLEQALKGIDPHVGFNVEIKWTMQLKDGSYELNHPFDLNRFLDTVIKVVFENCGSRKVVFSSFHPDLCTMLRLKQNRYPVLFLTQGLTRRWPTYLDPRAQTIEHATHFALAAGILGLNVYAELLLEDPSLIDFCKSKGLVLFCWGDQLNNKDVIKKLKAYGLDGLIYDRIEEIQDRKENIFQVEARANRSDIMKVAAQCRAVNGCS